MFHRKRTSSVRGKVVEGGLFHGKYRVPRLKNTKQKYKKEG